MSVIFWYRKDLRVGDHPALRMAIDSGSEVFAVVTADQLGTPFASLSEARRLSLISSWRNLNADLEEKLLVLESPKDLIEYANRVSAKKVFASRVYDTNGMAELTAIGADLKSSGIELVLGPGNYAIAPGTVKKSDGTSYRVYTPFFNEWVKLNPGMPFESPDLSTLQNHLSSAPAMDIDLEVSSGTPAGENFALVTLRRFVDHRVKDYADNRNRADLGGTSHLSHALSHGEIHPRTILALLPNGAGGDVFLKEIAWREFYADILYQRPETLSEYLNPAFAGMRYNEPGTDFAAWKNGQTGYPMVDAGMRQLATTGWMHNRVRMIVASFLIKDLHIEWQHGASWFEQNLTDFDPASNSHGWQWTAGCGTDASPYYRIFNPTGQGLKFDPNGDYVRKYVPELRHLSGAEVHEPWNHTHGYSMGYPKRIVDHATERLESLERLEEIRKKS